MTFWRGMEARSRFGLVLGALAILACVALLSWWLLKRDYQTLFTGLEERDAAAMVSELKRLKIPYRIEGDGNTIRVPAEVVHETRLSLMGRGINLSGGVGFEIFDNKDLGMTEYTQKINYQRALQGELARTIMAIDGVKLARVHLVLPEASIFKREKSRSKASVSLVLKPGGRLTSEQILGIQRLLAAAAPGLEPGMVTVLDQRGVALSAAADADSAAALGSGQLRLKQEVEQYLTRKAGEVLDRAFGPGQAIVSVDVALNFDEVKRTVQDVVPAKGGGENSGVVVRKRQTQQRQSNAAATSKDTAYGKEEADSGTSSSTLEIDYDVSRRMEQVVMAPGGVKRVSVGVLVPRGLADGQVAHLHALVAMAVGLDERRGDDIAIQGIDQFMLDAGKPEAAIQAPADPPPQEKPNRQNAKSTIAKDFSDPSVTAMLIAIVAAAVLLVGLIVAWLARRGRAVEVGTDAQTSDVRREELLSEVRGWLAAYRTESTGAERP